MSVLTIMHHLSMWLTRTSALAVRYASMGAEIKVRRSWNPHSPV